MRLIVLVWWLLLPMLLHAQIPGAVQVGDGVTKDQLEEARRIVRAAETSKFQWNVGEFEIFQKGPKAKGELLWEVSDESIVLVKEVPADFSLWIDAVRAGSKGSQLWEFPKQAESYWYFKGIKEGTTEIRIYASGEAGKKPNRIAMMTITVGKPVPPTPGPGPVPIPQQGLRVLMVLETKDLSNLPAEQVAAMNAQEVRQYLNAKCVKENGQPEWRVWDKDIDASRESAVWQEALKRKRDSLPWIVISNGQEGYEGPLPKNVAEMMTLLKKYGGN